MTQEDKNVWTMEFVPPSSYDKYTMPSPKSLGNLQSVFTVPPVEKKTPQRRMSRRFWRFLHNEVQKPHTDQRDNRRLKSRIYTFLDYPQTYASWCYHSILSLFVLACMLVGALNTVRSYHSTTQHLLRYMEIALIAIFTVEVLLRFWSSGSVPKYRGLVGKVRFFFRPWTILDLLVILMPTIHNLLEWLLFPMPDSPLRLILVFQMTRVIHANHQAGKAWSLLRSAVSAHLKELLTAMYFGAFAMTVLACMIFMIEGGPSEPPPGLEEEEEQANFDNYFEAFWWAWITLTTIGYGDKVPVTPAGKALTIVLTWTALCFFSLPASIVGAGLALKVQQKNKQKKFSRTVPTAVALIRRAFSYHFYESNMDTPEVWTRFLNYANSQPPPSSPTGSFSDAKPKKNFILHKLLKNDNSSHRAMLVSSHSDAALHQPMRSSGTHTLFEEKDSMKPASSSGTLCSIGAGTCGGDYAHLDDFCFPTRNYPRSVRDRTLSLVREQSCFTEVTRPMQHAVMAIKKMQFLVALRKFKISRKPVEVTDIIEQYTEGQLEMKARIRNVERKLEKILGKPGCHSKNNTVTVFSTLYSLEKKINHLESQMDRIINSHERKHEVHYLNHHLDIQKLQTTLNAIMEKLGVDPGREYLNNSNASHPHILEEQSKHHHEPEEFPKQHPISSPEIPSSSSKPRRSAGFRPKFFLPQDPIDESDEISSSNDESPSFQGSISSDESPLKSTQKGSSEEMSTSTFNFSLNNKRTFNGN